MFSKTAKLEKASVKSDPSLSAQSSDPARKTPRPASLISEHITIEGGVAGDGDLHVDGVIRGDVRIGHLTVGETGHIEGVIHADTVDVRGRIIGTLNAKQVRLYGAAYVDGDITHEQLSIETGAFFQGRSLKFQRPAPVALAAPDEAKSA